MVIDGAFGTEAIDSSGEILEIKGVDISDGEEGKALANWEHRDEEANGASSNDFVGKIIYVKKIFKKGDCETDRQRHYWDEIKVPFLYGMVRLFDGSGHLNAVSLAAIVRDQIEHNEPLLVRYSIQGGTLERKGNRLKRTIMRQVAITVKPCNKTAISGLVYDPKVDDSKPRKAKEDILENINKSELQHPNYRHLAGQVTMYSNPVVTEGKLGKALAASVPSAAPGGLVGGAALQREDRSARLKKLWLLSQAKAAARDYDPNKGDLKKFLANRLGGVLAESEDKDATLEKFAKLVSVFGLKKAEVKLAKMALIHNDPKNPMTVYRFENDDGEGPFQGAGFEAIRRYSDSDDPVERADLRITDQPGPEKTFDPSDYHMFHHGFSGQHPNPILFGFRKPEHLKQYFRPNVLRALERGGFVLKPTKAARVWSNEDGPNSISSSFVPEVFFEPHIDNEDDLYRHQRIRQAIHGILGVQQQDLEEPTEKSEPRTQLERDLRKHRIAIEAARLAKAMSENSVEIPEMEPVEWKGQTIKPGYATGNDGNGYKVYEFTGSGVKGQLGLAYGHKIGEEGGEPKRMSLGEGSSYTLHRLPMKYGAPTVVDADKHIITPQSEEQRALIHGLDLSEAPLIRLADSGAYSTHWRLGAHGKPVLVKSSLHGDPMSRKEAFAYELAKSFGLGDHVPVTAHILDPRNREREMSVQEGVENAESGYTKTSTTRDILQRMKDNGTLHRFGLFDTVLNNEDRHRGNFLFGGPNRDNMYLIDHGNTMANERRRDMEYLDYNDDLDLTKPLHKNAADWLRGLDPNEVRRLADKYRLERAGTLAGQRLQRMQLRHEQNPKASFNQITRNPDAWQPPGSV